MIKRFGLFSVLLVVLLALGNLASGETTVEKGKAKNPKNPQAPKLGKVRSLEPLETPTPKPSPAEPKFEIRAYTGYSNFLSNGDKKLWTQGFSGGVWVGYLLDPRVSFGFRMDYFYFEPSVEAFSDKYLGGSSAPGFAAEGPPSMNMIRFIPSLKLKLNPDQDDPVRPYLTLGVGFMNKSMADSGVSGNSGAKSAAIPGYSATVPALSAALGLPIALPDNYVVPLELELASGFTDGQPTTYWNISIGFGRDW